MYYAIFLQEKESDALRYKLDSHSPHSSSKFTLNSLCSPGIHYPVKDARVRLCPLHRQTGTHPPWSQNKPPLSFPLLQSKVAFKRRNSLRFCLPNSESPRGKDWEQSKRLGTEQLVPGEWVTTAGEGVEGCGDKAPAEARQQRKKRKQLCTFGSHGLERTGELSDSAWPHHVASIFLYIFHGTDFSANAP